MPSQPSSTSQVSGQPAAGQPAPSPTPTPASPASVQIPSAPPAQAPAAPPSLGSIGANDFADLAAKLAAFGRVSRETAIAVADSEIPTLHGHIASGVASGFLLVVLAPGGGVAVRTGVRDIRNYPEELQPALEREVEVDKQTLIKHTILALGMKLGQMHINIH